MVPKMNQKNKVTRKSQVYVIDCLADVVRKGAAVAKRQKKMKRRKNKRLNRKRKNLKKNKKKPNQELVVLVVARGNLKGRAMNQLLKSTQKINHQVAGNE